MLRKSMQRLLATALVMSTASAVAATPSLTEVPTKAEIDWISVSASSTNTVWLAGTQGTIARSTDAGASWNYSQPGSAELEFRDIEALDEQRAYALSIGDNGNSRIYFTSNGGRNWQLRYRAGSNLFLNCLAIAPNNEAWVLGDTQGERWQMVRSADGRNWLNTHNVVDSDPLGDEGGLSSSGQCVNVNNGIWAMGTGNAQTARLLIKTQFGIRFKAHDTPMTSGPMAGITAVWPLSERDILFAGGDLADPESTPQLMRYTDGEFIELPKPPLQGALYSLTLTGEQLLVTNPSGAALSNQVADAAAIEWTQLSDANLWSSHCANANRCYVVGKEGFVGRIDGLSDTPESAPRRF